MTEKGVADPRSHKIEPLGKKHDRLVFSCGIDALDTYLQKRASQEAKKKIATTFVMVESLTSEVIGYYSLSATNILFTDLPDETARKLPKYPNVTATLLGRLAIDSRYQGRGILSILKRTERSDINKSSITVYPAWVTLTNPRDIRPTPVPIGNLLKCIAGPKRNIFLERLGINHKADGKPLLCESARQAQAAHV